MALSIRKATKQYNQILSHYKGEEPRGRNRYGCGNCGEAQITNDIDAGVTPSTIDCHKCGSFAYSAMYILDAKRDAGKHYIEFYRPTLKKVLKMRTRNPNLLEHILQGGLMQRDLPRPPKPVTKFNEELYEKEGYPITNIKVNDVR